MTMTIMRASEEQKLRTKLEEGVRFTAYKDTVSIWTIGIGHASTNPRPVRGMLNGEYYSGRVCEGLTITSSEADRLFAEDWAEIEAGVSEMIRPELELAQHQFDALCDFGFQMGLHRLRTSGIIRAINFNPNSPGVLDEFMRWTMAGGQHQEYVWRRSARRAIVYSGNQIPAKLWLKCAPKGKGYAFICTADGDHIDYSITPTVSQIIKDGKGAGASIESAHAQESSRATNIAPTLENASTDSPEPVEAVRPAPEFTQPAAPAPASRDTLDLETPIPSAKASQQSQADLSQQVPATASVESPSKAEAGEGASVQVSPAPPPKPAIIPAERPKAKPVEVDTSRLRTDQMRVDAKPLEFSDRAMWFTVKLLGFWLKIMAGRGAIPLTAVSYYFDFFQDPFLSSVVISGGTWLLGQCAESVGKWKLGQHRATATTALV